MKRLGGTRDKYRVDTSGSIHALLFVVMLSGFISFLVPSSSLRSDVTSLVSSCVIDSVFFCVVLCLCHGDLDVFTRHVC